jgi:polyphosphate kinase 2 (PPK2 family)
VSRTKSETQLTSKPGKRKLKGKKYERELRKLQTELVEMQEWVRESGAKLVVLFEGSRYYNAQIDRAQAELNERLVLVQLYNALGGGWQQ